VTYHASLDDLDALVVRLRPSIGVTGSPFLAGLSSIHLSLWGRFARCYGRPPPRDALLPAPGSCEPMAFNDAEHFAQYVRSYAQRRAKDDLVVHGDGELAPSAATTGPDATVDGALSSLLLDQLRGAVASGFALAMPDAAEVQLALLAALDDLARGASGDLADLLRAHLEEIAPHRFAGTSAAARQHRSRGARRARAWVRAWLEVQGAAG
jgi:hypothetical protein